MSSSYFFLEDQFADLTEKLGQACDERGIDSQPIHEFFNYPGADLKAAIRAVERLERRLRGEGFHLPAAHPEPENKERDVPLGEQPTEKQQAPKVSTGAGGPPGDWVGPMSKAEVARRLAGDENASWRKVESLFKDTDVKNVSPHLVRVRVDHLDGPARARLKKNS